MNGQEAADKQHRRITLAIAALAALATYLDTTILFVAFPGISDSFDSSSASTLSWVLNAYTIIFAALLVPAGKLADRFGHRRAFLVGSCIFTLASLLCALAPTVKILIAARAIQGVGAAILVPASLALVMAAFPREMLPRVVAIWGAIGAFSAALGPSLGALIIDMLGWRWAFYINLPIGLVTLAAGMRYLRESKDATIPVPSFAGVVLIAIAAATLAYGIVESDSAGLTSPETVIVICIGLALLALFIEHQKATRSPTLDLELFSMQNFRWGNLAMFSFSAAFSIMFFSTILFLVNVWNWSVLEAGLAVAPGPALAAILAPRFGKLAGQIGQRPLVLAGGVLFATSALYRALLLGAQVQYFEVVLISLCLDAIAIALIFPQVTSVAVQSLPANRTGVGGAVTQAVRQFGGSFGVALTIGLLGAASTMREAGFDRIWWLLVAGGLVTAFCGANLKTRQLN